MPRFNGPQGKGAMRIHREQRYREAVARQRRLISYGHYRDSGFRLCTPAPIEQFLRKADR